MNICRPGSPVIGLGRQGSVPRKGAPPLGVEQLAPHAGSKAMLLSPLLSRIFARWRVMAQRQQQRRQQQQPWQQQPRRRRRRQRRRRQQHQHQQQQHQQVGIARTHAWQRRVQSQPTHAALAAPPHEPALTVSSDGHFMLCFGKQQQYSGSSSSHCLSIGSGSGGGGGGGSQAQNARMHRGSSASSGEPMTIEGGRALRRDARRCGNADQVLPCKDAAVEAQLDGMPSAERVVAERVAAERVAAERVATECCS